MFLVVVSVVGIVVLGSLAFGIQSLYIPAALAAVGWAVGVVIRYVRRHRALARSAASRQLVYAGGAETTEENHAPADRHPPRWRGSGLDDPTVPALVSGTLGLFAFNIVLGPIAILLGVLGLRGAGTDTWRRVRAIIGLALGVADLVLVVVLLLANLHYDGVTWHVDPR